ncbi:MAG: FG-GAP repeat domain-containing protein [Terriglobales bacterium]
MLSRLLLFSLFLSGLASSAVTFNDTYYQSSGAQGLGTVSGDFDRDGRPDMAVGTIGAVDVFRNIGGGKFSSAAPYAIAGNGNTLVATDVNNDGWLDIVVMAYQTDSVQILINNKNGTFHTGAPVPLTMPGDDIVAGDLNGDGKIDLLVQECNFNSTPNKCQFAVFKGTGTGAFAAGQVLALANASVQTPRLVDLNRDGKLDLVNVREPYVQIWLGKGDGSFNAPSSLRPPTVCTASQDCADYLSSLVVADFNNDTSLDIAVLQAHACGSACGDNTVYIYRNNGAASFTRVSSFRIGPSAGGLLLATDINGDQNIDLVNMNGAHFGGGLMYSLGKGNGSFGTQASMSDFDMADLLARDFNLDSRHDLAVSTWMSEGWDAFTNTNAVANCTAPSSANLAAKICGPANNASVTSPVLVKASGNSPAGVERLELWVDGKKSTERWNDQLAKNLTLSPGAHRIAVVAVDMYKGTATQAITVNVH